MQKELVVKDVIEKYADMVYRIALTRCGIVENAEDVFQDVFIFITYVIYLLKFT